MTTVQKQNDHWNHPQTHTSTATGEHEEEEEEEEAPTTTPSSPSSPRGAAMAMVIMSPLSELTDTDGFEMHSASQRASATPPPPPLPNHPWVYQAPLCRVLGYPGVTARPSSTAQPASSSPKRLFACLTGGVCGVARGREAPLTHFWALPGALPPPRLPPLQWPAPLFFLPKTVLVDYYSDQTEICSNRNEKIQVKRSNSAKISSEKHLRSKTRVFT